MPIQVLNDRAQVKYGEFVHALNFAQEQLGLLRKIVDRMDARKAKPGTWRVSTPDQLKGLYRTALADLEALQVQAKKYETELKSREWRV